MTLRTLALLFDKAVALGAESQTPSTVCVRAVPSSSASFLVFDPFCPLPTPSRKPCGYGRLVFPWLLAAWAVRLLGCWGWRRKRLDSVLWRPLGLSHSHACSVRMSP